MRGRLGWCGIRWLFRGFCSGGNLEHSAAAVGGDVLRDNGLLMLLGSRNTTRPAHAGVSGHHTTVSPLFFIAYPQTRVPAPSLPVPYAGAAGAGPSPLVDCSKPRPPKVHEPIPNISRSGPRNPSLTFSLPPTHTLANLRTYYRRHRCRCGGAASLAAVAQLRQIPPTHTLANYGSAATPWCYCAPSGVGVESSPLLTLAG